jgi:hypothetical protein
MKDRLWFLAPLAVAAVIPVTPASAQTRFPLWMGPGLLRTLGQRERAYFGKPLADVVVAMNKGPAGRDGACTAESQTGEPANASRPATFISDQGRLTPFGIAPLYWQVKVTCPHLKAVVSLSASPVEVAPAEGEKTPGTGDDVFESSRRFVIGEFALAQGARSSTGDESPPQADDRALVDPPWLARPVAIQIEAAKLPKDVRAAIDVASARTALASVAKSPARPAPAVESEVAEDDRVDPSELEASVFAYLIGRDNKRRQAVVVSRTWRGSLPSQAEDVLPGIAPDLLSSAITNYRRRNEESTEFPANVRVPKTKIVIAPEATLSRYFETGSRAEGWARFRKDFGDDQLFTFSRAGFSSDQTQAVVFMGYQGEGVGTSSIYFLQRDGKSWRLMYQLRVSVS